jgi:hypothetical protein
MLNMLTAPALTFVFMGVVFGLGIALVWMLGNRARDRPDAARIDRVSRGLFG